MRSILLFFPMMLFLLSADCQRPAVPEANHKVEKVSKDQLGNYSNAVFDIGKV